MTLAITTHVRGVEAARRHLGQLDEAYAQAQVAIIRPLGDRYLDVLKAETPEGRGEKPGRLRAAYETEERYGPTSGGYRIRNQTPYLRPLLRGRGPVAARGRALRFVIDGQVFFRRRVGPAKPNPFPDRARQIMQPALDRAPRELAGAIIRIYRGGV